MFRNFVLLFAVVVATAQAQVSLEQCHTLIMTPHHFLNLPRFLGTWYPLRIAPSKAHQMQMYNLTCPSTTITETAPGQLSYLEEWNVVENGIVTGPGSGVSDVVVGVPRNHSAIWTYFYTPPESDVPEESQSVVLMSDESSWAVLYSCRIRNGELEERISLMSRRRTIDPLLWEFLDIIMWGIGFPRENFYRFDHSQC